MRNLIGAILLAATALLSPAASAQDQLTLKVDYAYPNLIQPTQEELARRFMQGRPDIRIELSGPAKDYEELIQRTFRGSLTGDLPDVAYHGLNAIRHLAERDLLVPLEPFIKGEPDWESMGYMPSMLRLVTHAGKTYGLPFSISVPIVYYNGDLVRRAGGDPRNLPRSWAEIADLARRISALGGGAQGVFTDYAQGSLWQFLAFVTAEGGRMMSPDEKAIAFDGEAGMRTLRLMRDLGQAGMLDQTDPQATQAFIAGTLGIYVTSSSRLGNTTRGVGNRFELLTGPMPMAEGGTLPAGGNAAMIHTRDPAKQKAAWEYIKFVTGPAGQTLMVRNTGYMPGNSIPVEDETMLARHYRENPNLATSAKLMPVLSEYYTFPGENSIKIGTVVRDHMRDVATLRRAPEEVMPAMVRDVRAMLPK